MPRKPLFFLPLILVILTALPVLAGPLSFTVDPMAVETAGTPGAPVTGVITVDNPLSGKPGDVGETVRLRVYAQDWTLDRAGTPQFGRPASTPGSCSGWLQVNPVEVVVPPGESRPVRYTLSVPPGASGTYHTILMFATAPTPMQAGQRVVSINGRIGSAIYVQVGPQVKRARITAFSVMPQNTTLTVQNTGNSHVRLKGTLQFRDGDGHLVQQVPLPGGVILPGADNVRDLSLPTPHIAGGPYVVTALLDYGGDVLAGARTHVHLP